MLSETNKKRINAIQYNSLRLAFRKPIKTETSVLLELAKTISIEERVNDLNIRYIKNCYKNRNQMIIYLIRKYINWYPLTRDPKYKTFLCIYKDVINNINNSATF